MQDSKIEIRTPNKHLLIGTLLKEDNDLFLVIKNRGKTDYIAIEMLISSIHQYDHSDSSKR